MLRSTGLPSYYRGTHPLLVPLANGQRLKDPDGKVRSLSETTAWWLESYSVGALRWTDPSARNGPTVPRTNTDGGETRQRRQDVATPALGRGLRKRGDLESDEALGLDA